MKAFPPETVGVILAGGRAQRMEGRDKAFIVLDGAPILTHVAKHFAPQCLATVISANGDPSRFKTFQLPVVPDTIPDHPGPLAGILAALEWVAKHHPSVDWVASVTVDAPFIPDDFVLRLHEARSSRRAELAIAQSAERNHPACALWPVSSSASLRQAIQAEGLRKVGAWVARHDTGTAVWPSHPVDPFFNINTPEDLKLAQSLIDLADN